MWTILIIAALISFSKNIKIVIKIQASTSTDISSVRLIMI